MVGQFMNFSDKGEQDSAEFVHTLVKVDFLGYKFSESLICGKWRKNI